VERLTTTLLQALTIRYNLWQVCRFTNMGKRTGRDRRISLTPRDEEVESLIHTIADLQIHVMLGALLWLLAAGALWQGIRGLAIGLYEVHHPASALRVVRGLRGVIVAVSLAALGGGMLFTSIGLLVCGLIFLGEELYETGVILLALRAGQRGVWA
jgi:hypothetical protein